MASRWTAIMLYLLVGHDLFPKTATHFSRSCSRAGQPSDCPTILLFDHLGGARKNAFGELQPDLLRCRLVDDQIGALGHFYRDIAGLLALEDAHHYLARLNADIVVVEAECCDRAAIHRIGISREQRQLCFLG